MVCEILVKIGSGNGLLPDGTKPLPEPMLTYDQERLVAFNWGYCHQKIWRYVSVSVESCLLKTDADPSETNELKYMKITGLFTRQPGQHIRSHNVHTIFDDASGQK